VTKKIVPRYYAFLQKQSEIERKEISDQLIDALRVLFTDPIIAGSAGPYLAGSKLTYAVIMLAPFALRFGTVLKRYRNFEIPSTPEWTRYNQWLDAIRNDPSIKATLADDEKLITFYARYADNSAQSLVADAIRKGDVLP